jgi:ABC-2 type transport system ATP-binding protein
MTPSPIIQVRNLVKYYYGKKAVNDITLAIPESCFALLGSNGAGKTTTILMLLGLIRPTSGSAYLFEKPISTRGFEVQSSIGYMPEDVGFYPSLTGWDHLEFYERVRTNSYGKSERPAQFLEWCGLEQESWHNKVKTYSRGMK